jgi:hypothetical protein
VALITHPHLALRLKKEESYTSTPPLGFHGLLYGELYHYYYYYYYYSSSSYYLYGYRIQVSWAAVLSSNIINA